MINKAVTMAIGMKIRVSWFTICAKRPFMDATPVTCTCAFAGTCALPIASTCSYVCVAWLASLTGIINVTVSPFFDASKPFIIGILRTLANPPTAMSAVTSPLVIIGSTSKSPCSPRIALSVSTLIKPFFLTLSSSRTLPWMSLSAFITSGVNAE